jgi:hypothetical protein
MYHSENVTYDPKTQAAVICGVFAALVRSRAPTHHSSTSQTHALLNKQAIVRSCALFFLWYPPDLSSRNRDEVHAEDSPATIAVALSYDTSTTMHFLLFVLVGCDNVESKPTTPLEWFG